MKTLTKPQTHIARARLDDLNAAQQIQYMLGWTEQMFCDHQFEQYERFIRRICCDRPDQINSIRYSPVFRGFWNNEWMIRNKSEFLPYSKLKEMEIGSVVDEYLFINSYYYLCGSEEFMVKYRCLRYLITP